MASRLLQIWPALDVAAYLARPLDVLPYPLGDAKTGLFERARHGLWHGVRAAGLKSGDEVLVPAYHHGSEVQALLDADLIVRLFDLDAALRPVPSELEALVGPATRALLLIHYYGFPQDAGFWRDWSRARELLLIEDVAQSWLAEVDGRPVGSTGDLAIWCPYKTFGLPHVGLLRSEAPPREPSGRPAAGVRALAGLHLRWAQGRGALLPPDGPSPLEIAATAEPGIGPESEYALGDAERGPGAAVRFLLPRVADPAAAASRRANYEVLLDEIGALVPPPFSELPRGASPLVFPVDRTRLAGRERQLRAAGVVARPFWADVHPLAARGYPVATAWRGRVLALPVHQELVASDLDRIAAAVRGPKPGAGPRPRPPRVEVFESVDGVREPWASLALERGNVFSSPEWAEAWLRHHPSGAVRIAVVTGAGDGTAVVPLHVARRGPLRIGRFIGHGQADELGPLVPSGAGMLPGRALLAALRGIGDWDVFVGERLLEPSLVSWLGGRVLRRESSPVVRRGNLDWESYLMTRSSRLRHELRHDDRKLRADHDVAIRLSEGAGLAGDLDALFRLHGLRWAGRSDFLDARPFHEEFARAAAKRGWLRLWLLEIDGAPVAGSYGFRYGGVESSYQVGRDPAWSRESVGLVLMGEVLRAAFADGVAEYRFLRGDEPYKQRLATDRPTVSTVALSRGPLGRAALAGVLGVNAAGPARRAVVRLAG